MSEKSKKNDSVEEAFWDDAKNDKEKQAEQSSEESDEAKETSEFEGGESEKDSDSAEDEACDTSEAGQTEEGDSWDAESDGDEDVGGAPKKKDPKDVAIEELQDRVKRQMAEFDNFRKRTEKEKSAMFEMGASDIIKKLLPIVDNFDRGFKSVTDEDLETPFVKGMDMVRKQFAKMLEDSDVKPIEAVGQEFNPDFHNAVMHVEDDSVGENIVVEEFEKGYTYHDQVIRHSMVKVAN